MMKYKRNFPFFFSTKRGKKTKREREGEEEDKGNEEKEIKN